MIKGMVGCRKYWFGDIGKEREQIILFHIVFGTDKLLITLYNQRSNYDGVCMEIFDMWLILPWSCHFEKPYFE